MNSRRRIRDLPRWIRGPTPEQKSLYDEMRKGIKSNFNAFNEFPLRSSAHRTGTSRTAGRSAMAW
jgi:hypothetical protein